MKYEKLELNRLSECSSMICWNGSSASGQPLNGCTSGGSPTSCNSGQNALSPGVACSDGLMALGADSGACSTGAFVQVAENCLTGSNP